MARILRIGTKTSDCFWANIDHLNIEYDGYPPTIKGIGGNDYLGIEIDLDTGKVVGLESLTDEQLKVLFNGT